MDIMRELTSRELDAVAGGDRPETHIILTNQQGVVVGLPNSHPTASADHSPNIDVTFFPSEVVPLGRVS
jgi:hypothetical protein